VKGGDSFLHSRSAETCGGLNTVIKKMEGLPLVRYLGTGIK
jgi:hypothetical protein